LNTVDRIKTGEYIERVDKRAERKRRFREVINRIIFMLNVVYLTYALTAILTDGLGIITMMLLAFNFIAAALDKMILEE
jgi:hypothetical protein